MLNAIILDTETAQKDGNACEIASAWVYMQDGALKRSDLHCERFNPMQPMHFGALATHHITPDMLKDCQSHTQYHLPENVRLIIGHNVDFDMQVLQRTGAKIDGIYTICTLALSRHLWPELDSHSLSAMTYFTSPDFATARESIRNAHSAAADVLMTFDLLCAIVAKSKVQTMQDLYRLSETARTPTKMHFGKHKGVALYELPEQYVQWLLSQDSTDKYLRAALENRNQT